MKKINIDKKIKTLSDELSVNSSKNVIHYFPIDRFFIEDNGFLEKILSVDYLEFLLCNLENINPTYTVQLFVCLPELWEKVTYEDVVILIENFTNSFSFYSLIEYTYKYLEIDLFETIMSNQTVDYKFKKDCINFGINSVATLYIDECDYFEFEENLFGIDMKQINMLREKYKSNTNFKKAISPEKLYEELISYKA